jgi:hypothetical protein
MYADGGNIPQIDEEFHRYDAKVRIIIIASANCDSFPNVQFLKSRFRSTPSIKSVCLLNKLCFGTSL